MPQRETRAVTTGRRREAPGEPSAARLWSAIARLFVEGLLVFDRRGRLVEANQAARQLLGLESGDIERTTAASLCDSYGHPLAPDLNPVIAAARHGEPVPEASVCWRRGDGLVVPVVLRVEPLPSVDRDVPQAVAAVVRARVEDDAVIRQIDRLKADSLRHRHLLDLVFESVDSGIAVLESDDRLALWNSAFERICGIELSTASDPPSMADIFGALDWGFTQRQRAAFDAAVAGARVSLEPVSFQVITRQREVDVYTCRLAGGRRMWVLRDNTEHRRLVGELQTAWEQVRAEHSLIESVFANVETGISVLDDQSRVVAYNPAWARLWQLDPEWLATSPAVDEVVARIAHLFDPAVLDEFTGELRQLRLSGRSGRVEVERKDGRYLTVYTAPLGDGRQLYSCRDLTEWRALESSLQARNEQLAQALREQEETSRELAEANALLREADRLKSEFLANTSHELRTPLNSILGYLGLLADGLFTGPSEVRRFAATAQRSAESLLKLISDLLDVARAESQQLELRAEPVPIWLAVDDVCNAVRPAAEAKGLRLTLPEPDFDLMVTADPERLRQVLLNVIDNAVKFTPSGGVTVSFSREPERVVVDVVDTGIGIPPAKLEQIFERFVQVDGSSRRLYGGTGLGLALSRSLVELMGGTIHAESDGEGCGTRVRIALLPG